MIRKGTSIQVIDNSGAALIECIHVPHPLSYASVGNVIVGSVKRLKRSIQKRRVKKGQVVSVLVVSVSKPLQRSTGFTLKSFFNLGIILNKDLTTPPTTRLKRYVYQDIRFFGFSKLLALAKVII